MVLLNEFWKQKKSPNPKSTFENWMMIIINSILMEICLSNLFVEIYSEKFFFVIFYHVVYCLLRPIHTAEWERERKKAYLKKTYLITLWLLNEINHWKSCRKLHSHSLFVDAFDITIQAKTKDNANDSGETLLNLRRNFPLNLIDFMSHHITCRNWMIQCDAGQFLDN